jgi:hypothetical protein
MSGGIWTLTELVTAPAATRGEDFAWSASPSPGTLGGSLGNLRARAAPKAPWTFGGSMRHVRTDYPGSTTPSVQILGPKHDTFTIEGMFDDRFNFPGYAVGEMRRLEEMCKRGNLCRVAFQDQAFYGIFIDWKFPYRRDWQIGYTLHLRRSRAARRVRPESRSRPGGESRTDVRPDGPCDPGSARGDAERTTWPLRRHHARGCRGAARRDGLRS